MYLLLLKLVFFVQFCSLIKIKLCYLQQFRIKYKHNSEWQWHQLGHMQVCTSLQTDNHDRCPIQYNNIIFYNLRTNCWTKSFNYYKLQHIF